MSNEKKSITESSGNVFADLGIENAKELQAKAELAREIRVIINERNLTQKQAAELFGTHQTQVSRLNNGAGIESMTFDLLMTWLTKLNRNVTLSVKKAPKRQAHIGQIQVAL